VDCLKGFWKHLNQYQIHIRRGSWHRASMNDKDSLPELKGQKGPEETALKLYGACEDDSSSIAVQVDRYSDGDLEMRRSDK
jgi:hypothetical protein